MLAKLRVRFAFVSAVGVCAACSSSFARDEPEIVPVIDGGTDVQAPEAAPPDVGTVVDAGGASDASDASDAGDAAVDAAEAGPPAPIVFTGASDRILLTGMVVTPDTAFDGEVLVE